LKTHFLPRKKLKRKKVKDKRKKGSVNGF